MSSPKPLTSPSPHPFPLVWSLLLCLLGGGMMASAFPPLDLDMFVWIGLIPLLTALWTGSQRRGKKGFFIYVLMGWVFGFIYYGCSFWWVNEVMASCGWIPPILMAGYLAIYPALWAGVMGVWLRPKFETAPAYHKERDVRMGLWRKWCFRDMRTTLMAIISGAGLWVCMEWFRGWGLTGFSWNSLGVALYNGLSLAQWAEFIGVAGLAFIPAMVNISLWCVGRRLGTMLLIEGRRTVPWDFFCMVFVLMSLFLGGVLLSSSYASNERTLPVLALQQNYTQDYKWNPQYAADIYLDTAQSTLKACLELQEKSINRASETGVCQLDLPTWVIWPESSFPTSTMYSFESGELSVQDQNNTVFLGTGGYINEVREACSGDFVLLTGCDEMYWKKDKTVGKMYNTLSVFSGDFSTKMSYDKIHLVPFGEYIPLRRVFPFLEKAFAFFGGMSMGNDFTPGDSFEPLEVPFAPRSEVKVGVIPAICFEDTVGGQLRKFVRPTSQVIVNVTNDGWFNESWANEQHCRNAAFRCIELRRSMIRAANTGVTAAIAPNGAVIQSLRNEWGSPFVKGYIFARLPLPSGKMTLYALAGDWFVGLCAVMTGLILWRRRQR
ncbi:MAG: apolipoprotein N-acyltransferase [Akkermansia sp.]